jgi:hypothetical protein
MPRTAALIATAVAAASLAAAPAAMAHPHTSNVGEAHGEAHQNVCLVDYACTYVNYKHGKASDIVKHTGAIKQFTLKAPEGGGTIRLRILRPAGHGKFRFIRSSGLKTVSENHTTFKTYLKVRKGDVLGLTNSTSGLYMREDSNPASTDEVRTFSYTTEGAQDGHTYAADRSSPGLHTLLTAKVSY